MISRSTFDAIDESRRATSSVTTARSDCPASRSIRPWPISPPAPVMSTTGLRTCELYWSGHGDPVRSVLSLLHARRIDHRRTPRKTADRSISPGPCAWTTCIPVDPSPARRSRSIASSTTARGRGAGRNSSTRRTSASISSRCATHRAAARSTPAASRRSMENGRRPRRSRPAIARFTSRCGSPGPRSRCA